MPLPPFPLTPPDLESIRATLESISTTYPTHSPEHQALKIAAHALLFAQHETLREKFFHQISERDLTPNELARLKSMGLDVEEWKRDTGTTRETEC